MRESRKEYQQATLNYLNNHKTKTKRNKVTTKVLIVNLGPHPIQIDKSSMLTVKLMPYEATEKHVWFESDVIIKEITLES